jgi:hypothetical protein
MDALAMYRESVDALDNALDDAIPRDARLFLLTAQTLLLDVRKVRMDFLKLFYSRWLAVYWDLLQIHSTAGALWEADPSTQITLLAQ